MAVSVNARCDFRALPRKVELGSRVLGFSRASVTFSRPRIDVYPSICTAIRANRIRALVVDPSDSAQENPSQFAKRMEKAWLISKYVGNHSFVMGHTESTGYSCKIGEGSAKIEGPYSLATEYLFGEGSIKIEGAYSLATDTWKMQPSPVSCSSCDANGSVECKWCKGTGFFILGDNMLCEIPSRNTTCVICMGQGLVHCVDCKGTGFRARWLGQPSMKTAKSDPE